MSHKTLPDHVTLSQNKAANEESTDNDEQHRSRNAASNVKKHSVMSQGPGLLEMVAGDEPDEEDKLDAHSSSIIKFYPDCCRRQCGCCSHTPKPVADDAGFKDQMKDFFQCPPSGTFARLLLCTLICLGLWGFLFYLFKPFSRRHKTIGHHEKETNPAWLNGPLFGLAIVEITGLISGILLKKLGNLPPLLGPLILGIVYHNVSELNVFILLTDFDHRNCENRSCIVEAERSVNNWVKPIRVLALGIILTRAGLELSPKQLSKLKGVVPLLAFGPCIVEATTCALTSFVFFNVMETDEDKKMGLAMCFVGGFALAAVSPAVVVPGALSLKKAGYGVVKGVPTLLIAASSIDDVLAISIYTIALGFAIREDDSSAWKSYSGGAIGLGVGIVHGFFFGMIMHFLPSQLMKYKAHNRLLVLLLINFTSVLAYEETFFNGAGSISVLVTSLIAGFGWRSQPHWKMHMRKIERALAHFWVLWVPLIFGTIGKEIDFKAAPFQPPTIYKIFGVIGISLVFRCLTAFFASGCGTNYSIRERFFIALSWIPKATVQAALAPLVLTRASAAGKDESSMSTGIKSNAEIVVNIAILAVLITAPTGCVLIACLGPKCLEKNTSPEMEIEIEFPNGEGIDPTESAFQLVAEIVAAQRNSLDGEPNLEKVIANDPAPLRKEPSGTTILSKLISSNNTFSTT